MTGLIVTEMAGVHSGGSACQLERVHMAATTSDTVLTDIRRHTATTDDTVVINIGRLQRLKIPFLSTSADYND